MGVRRGMNVAVDNELTRRDDAMEGEAAALRRRHGSFARTFLFQTYI